MDKTKKIIISLAISLVIVVVLNYVVITNVNSNYIEIPVFKEDMLKGKRVEWEDIITIQVKRTKENEAMLQESPISSLIGKTLGQDVYKGDFVRGDNFIDNSEIYEEATNYQYISIPINDLSYATCNKLKRGDKVAVYYTAKTKDVSNAIKDKKRLYSNTAIDGLVTCLLFETVEIISVHDNTGKETKENIVTDVLLRLQKEEAILVANLKSQGTFDIVLN